MRRKLRLLAGLVALVLLACPCGVPPAARAAEGVIWQQIGPYGGGVIAMTAAAGPQASIAVYAGTEEGWVFRSTDSGLHWQRLAGNGDFSTCGAAVDAIAVNPHAPEDIWATCWGGGVRHSLDGGATWQDVNTGGSSWWQNDVLVDAGNPPTVYVANADYGVFKTTDEGENWTLTLPNVKATRLAYAPGSPAGVYASTSAGLYKSTDAGATWQQLAGLPAGGAWGLAVAPTSPTTVYAGVSTGVMKSLDAGATWQPTGSELAGRQVSHLAVDALNPSTVYAVDYWAESAFKSSDAGGHWTLIDPALTGKKVNCLTLANPPAAAMSPAGDTLATSDVFIGVEGNGVLRSGDGGASWQVRHAGMLVWQAGWVAAMPALPGTGLGAPAVLFVAPSHGPALVSRDGGATWADALMPSAGPMVADPQAAGTYHLGIRGPALYRTTDGGLSWSQGSGLRNDLRDVDALDIDPLNPDTIYAAIEDDQLYKSTDGGAHWYATTSGIPWYSVVGQVAVDPLHPEHVFVGTADEGIFKSSDYGAHWSAANQGLTIDSVGYLRAGPPLPVNPGATVLYVLSGEIYRSTDGAANWSQVSSGLASLSPKALAVDPQRSGRLYVGTYGSGVLMSDDGGQTLRPVNTGLAAPDVTCLVLDPQTPGVLYASTYGGGIYKGVPSEITTSLYLPLLVR